MPIGMQTIEMAIQIEGDRKRYTYIDREIKRAQPRQQGAGGEGQAGSNEWRLSTPLPASRHRHSLLRTCSSWAGQEVAVKM